MLVIGKGLGGGIFPLAALIARAGLNIATDRALGHYTHEKNPVACAAAMATIECIEDEELLKNATEMGAYAVDRLRGMMDIHKIIGSVRGLGLLIGVELVRDHETRERASEEAEQIMYSALARGLSFKVSMGNVLTLTPPLTISKAEIDNALDILERCFEEVK